MRSVVAVILGGGRGERLKPLTSARAKPAVPFAGKYRLVDIPISNCLHVGIVRIFVLTQYQSASLNRHVSDTYRFDHFSKGHVSVLAAEQTDHGDAAGDWYHGTADAVRKMLHRLEADPDDDVLILSGDQVYTMDLGHLIRHHRERDAEITVAATRVTRDDAQRFGVMKIDDDAWLEEFAEKPKDAPTLDRFQAPDPVDTLTHLGSMGIYAFKASVLFEALDDDPRDDFGKHIIPASIGKRRLLVYPFTGYWEDVGTVRSYHSVNLELTESVPDFNLFDERYPIFTRARFLPPAKVGRADVHGAVVSDGAIIGDRCRVRRSVIGIRTILKPGCDLENVVCNGAGSYDLESHLEPDQVPLGVGEGSVLRNVIVDRDCRIGRNVRLVNERGVDSYADDVIAVRDGIIVVPRQTTVPDGYSF